MLIPAKSLASTVASRGNTERYAESVLGKQVDIVSKLGGGFQVQPKRWVVERTLF